MNHDNIPPPALITVFFLLVPILSAFFSQVVRHRRQLEYAIHRRQQRKEDYLKYIQVRFQL